MTLAAPFPYWGRINGHDMVQLSHKVTSLYGVGRTLEALPTTLCKRGAWAMDTLEPTIEYRHIPGFPGYCVGSDGSVWTCKKKGGNDRTPGQQFPTWSRLTTHQDARGYVRVNLDNHGVNYHRLVHHLVLEAFVGPRPAGYEACHYPDADKTNNALDNLRWDTHNENIKDRYRDRPAATHKCCRLCGAHKPVDQFYTDRRASDGLKTTCKACHIHTAKRTRNPAKRRTANRLYMRKVRCNTHKKP